MVGGGGGVNGLPLLPLFMSRQSHGKHQFLPFPPPSAPFRDGCEESTKNCLPLLLHVFISSSQRTFRRSGRPKWNTSVPTYPSSWWATRRTYEMTSTHAGSWTKSNRCVHACALSPKFYLLFFFIIFQSTVCNFFFLFSLVNAQILQEPVKSEEGRDMAHRIGAVGYLECSAKTKDGVREVFEMATRAALQVRKRKNRKGCELLWGHRLRADQLLAISSCSVLLLILFPLLGLPGGGGNLKSLASVNHTCFTNADTPLRIVKDWHTGLKAKHISLSGKQTRKHSATYCF